MGTGLLFYTIIATLIFQSLPLFIIGITASAIKMFFELSTIEP